MLYKYLPTQFAVPFVERGEVLFRTLSYFRKIEHAARGDAIEGVHMDVPAHHVLLEVPRLGKTFVGRYRALNSIDQVRVYAFCCSRSYSNEMKEEFGCDRCVAIHDPDTFFLRCRTAARRHATLEPPGLLHREVAYYASTGESPLPITDPHALPFLKHRDFASQDEYRAVFATTGGFNITRRIVQPAFTFDEEIQQAPCFERLLRLGSLKGVADLID